MAQRPQSLVLLSALGQSGNSPFVILLSVASDIKRETGATLAGDPKKTTQRPHWENAKSSSCNPFVSLLSLAFLEKLYFCAITCPPTQPSYQKEIRGGDAGGSGGAGVEHPAPTLFQQGQRGSRGGRSSESLHAEPHSGLQDPAAFLQGDSLFAANPPRQI